MDFNGLNLKALSELITLSLEIEGGLIYNNLFLIYFECGIF